jgi:hypothetical protein
MKSLLMAVAGAAMITMPAQASIVPVGSQLNMILTNFTGCSDSTCSTLTTFGGTSLVDGGLVTLTTTQVATGGGGEWDIFKLTTVNGGPLVGDVDGDWQIQMQYHLSKNVNFDAIDGQWLAGPSYAPVSPISNFSGICCATNTPNILSGPAYSNSGFKAPYSAGQFDYPGGGIWDEIFVDPFNLAVSGGGIPATTDGYTYALHFDPQTPVPEASTWAMMLLGLAGIGVGAYSRSRRINGRVVSA